MRSDKGQQSVALCKEDYEIGMNKLLNDRDNYKPANKDPTTSVASKNNKFVKKLLDLGIIIEKNRRYNPVT
jgi:hypothetical protein